MTTDTTTAETCPGTVVGPGFGAEASGDPRPHLAPDYRLPQPPRYQTSSAAVGVGRLDALHAGLADRWRVLAAHDDPDRRRSEAQLDSFTLYLLDGPDRYAIVALANRDWIGHEDRHTLMTETLAGAPVAPTLAGLAAHFINTDEPFPTLAVPFHKNARRDALCLLLTTLTERSSPDLSSIEFMLTLSGLGPRVEAWRDTRARLVYQRRRKRAADRISDALQERGITDTRFRWRIEATLRVSIDKCWDPTRHMPGPEFEKAATEALARVLGNTLDDVLPGLLDEHLFSR